MAEVQGRCLLEAYPVEHQQLLLSRMAVPRPLRLWVKDTMLYFGTKNKQGTHLLTLVCTDSRNILHLLAIRSFCSQCVSFLCFLQCADICIDLSNSKRMTTQYSTCLYYFALHFCIYYMWTLITFNSKVLAST